MCRREAEGHDVRASVVALLGQGAWGLHGKAIVAHRRFDHSGSIFFFLRAPPSRGRAPGREWAEGVGRGEGARPGFGGCESDGREAGRELGSRRRARPCDFGGTIIPRTYPRAPDCQSMSPLLFGRRRESMTWPELSGAISRQRSDGRRRQEPSCCYATMTTDAARLGLPGQWTENRVRSLGASRTAGPGAGRGDTSFDSHPGHSHAHSSPIPYHRGQSNPGSDEMMRTPRNDSGRPSQLEAT